MLGEADLAIPAPQVGREIRRRWFLRLCQEFVDQYFGCSEVLAVVDQLHELQNRSECYFPCRAEGCESTYVYHSRRVRYSVILFNLF